eukprot:2516620-Pleurochrysis_carterae.AAC.2
MPYDSALAHYELGKHAQSSWEAIRSARAAACAHSNAQARARLNAPVCACDSLRKPEHSNWPMLQLKRACVQRPRSCRGRARAAARVLARAHPAEPPRMLPRRTQAFASTHTSLM